MPRTTAGQTGSQLSGPRFPAGFGKTASCKPDEAQGAHASRLRRSHTVDPAGQLSRAATHRSSNAPSPLPLVSSFLVSITIACRSNASLQQKVRQHICSAIVDRCPDASEQKRGNQVTILRKGTTMNFVLVNDRAPRGARACAHCSTPIGLGYLRDVSSKLLYCDHECYVRYSKQAPIGSLAEADDNLPIRLVGEGIDSLPIRRLGAGIESLPIRRF